VARRHAGLTQQDVAEGVGIVPEVYGRIERGGSLPSVSTLFRLCVTLHRGPNELMGFVPLRGEPPGQERCLRHWQRRRKCGAYCASSGA
jgi:transcriptional regulator with XRE-family HTH domain